jgi:hypothetical protein
MGECNTASGSFFTGKRLPMSDSFVTVATFSVALEAQMARSLLQDEGIPAQVTGDLAATTLGISALGGQVQVMVAPENVDRAKELLAPFLDKAQLSEDWQDEAESDAWVCSLCGTAVSNELIHCTACATARDAVQTGLGIQSHVRRQSPEQFLDKPDEITTEQPVSSPGIEEPDQEIEAPNLARLYGDDLVKRALAGAMVPFLFYLAYLFTCWPFWFLLIYIPATGYSGWCLARLFLFSNADLSKRGLFYLIVALMLHVLNFAMLLLPFLY